MSLKAEIAAQVGTLELDLAVDIEAGACLALTGPSGAGKTSVLRTIAGLRRPDRGRIECGGATWFDARTREDLPAERRRCGYVFQDYALFPHMTALANVGYGIRGGSRSVRRRAAQERLDALGLSPRANARPAQLSGGERQRVALARALASDPAALLFDEPLAALDPTTRAGAARELAATLAEARVPTILVTHDFEQAALLGSEVAVLECGRIVQRGAAAELAAAPASAFVADLTGASVLRGDARPTANGLTVVELDGGGVLTSTDHASGRVAASVHPWEVALDSSDAAASGSEQNRLAAEVTSVSEVGNRVRVGLALPQPLAAEITSVAGSDLSLSQGGRVTAVFKAVAVRLI